MWPWEHVAFGYLAYSLFSHLVSREAPGDGEAVAIGLGSVLPDLIDKPLAWEFGVFPSGSALGHSVFFAGPLSLAAVAVAGWLGRTRAGLAFASAYLLHLAGDVLPAYAEHGTWYVDHLLWPVVVVESPREPGGFVDGFLRNFEPWAADVLSGDPTPYFATQLGMGVAAVLLWLYDGTPGQGWVRSCVRKVGAVVRGGRDLG